MSAYHGLLADLVVARVAGTLDNDLPMRDVLRIIRRTGGQAGLDAARTACTDAIIPGRVPMHLRARALARVEGAFLGI